MKLLDLIKEILREGISKDYKDENKFIIDRKNNNIGDLFFIELGNTNLLGININYSFKYNQDSTDSKGLKALSDAIKKLDQSKIDTKEIEKIIETDIKTLFNRNFIPDIVYVADSSQPLAKKIAEIIKNINSNIKIIPLQKTTYENPYDMLVDGYENLIKNPKLRKLAEEYAEKMHRENNGKFKSTGLPPQLRKYFKPKYSPNNFTGKKGRIMVVDDNTQTGTDYKHIQSYFSERDIVLFYVVELMNRSGKGTTKTIVASKQTIVPNKTPFKDDDLKDFGPEKGLGLSSTHDDVKLLQGKKVLSSAPLRIGSKTYYLFINKNIRKKDLI